MHITVRGNVAFILSTAFFVVMLSACEHSGNTDIKIVSDLRIAVNLEVDFAGRSENFSATINVPAESTVIDMLSKAQDDGRLTYDGRGSGSTAFVTAINGIQNEMAAGSNWIFLVNGELADRGCGDYILSGSDIVQWKFAAEYLE